MVRETGLAILILAAQGRVAANMLASGLIDLGLGTLFVIARARTAAPGA